MAAVSVKCKSFRYEMSDTVLLENVDFHIEYGEVALLAGASGCGKSTLLQMISGIIPRIMPARMEGEILIDGEDLSDASLSRVSRKVGTVLQNADAQIIHQTVEDEIAFACENFGIPADEIDRRIDESCKMMRLERGMRTRTLSGGQKQRLVTAATLAMKTRILILDEPLANLDARGAGQLLALLRKLAHDKGYAVLLAEHRLDVVLPYVDIVWRLEEGCLSLVKDKKAYFKARTSIVQDRPENSLNTRGEAFSCVNLRKAFKQNTVLEDITADIYKGERILLLGENGCGKTTLLKILARLVKPDGGRVAQFIDMRLKKRPNKAWFRSVGVVYQNPNYQLFMPTVEEELKFGGGEPDYIRYIAECFKLTELLSRNPHSLSEGQKRRVSIAAILSMKPKVLLLDEPTVGQDLEALSDMVGAMNEIHRDTGNTMVTVSHDFRCARALCDRAFWIEDAKIRKIGGKEVVDEFFDRNHGMSSGIF